MLRTRAELINTDGTRSISQYTTYCKFLIRPLKRSCIWQHKGLAYTAHRRAYDCRSTTALRLNWEEFVKRYWVLSEEISINVTSSLTWNFWIVAERARYPIWSGWQPYSCRSKFLAECSDLSGWFCVVWRQTTTRHQYYVYADCCK